MHCYMSEVQYLPPKENHIVSQFYNVHFVLDTGFLQGSMYIILLLLHSAYVKANGI